MSKKLSRNQIFENIDAINMIKNTLGNQFKARVSVKYDDFCPENTTTTDVTISDNNIYMEIFINFVEYADKFYSSYSSDYNTIRYNNSIITIYSKDKNNMDIKVTIYKI